jgi:pimeloyl-ACP methyl ester carboxylesterase
MPLINVKGLKLNIESIRLETIDSETVIIFLHEALGSIPQWRNFPHELCVSLKMNGLVYERQGHGKSDPLTEKRNSRYLHDYAFRELADLIETVLSPDQKIILVGHSDGGSIALLFAAKYPKNVVAVITLGTHLINEPESVAGIAPAVVAYESGKLNKLNDFHGDKTNSLFYAWADTWSHEDFADWTICEDVSHITSPVLAMQGTKDQYGTEKQLALIEQYITTKPKTVLISDCGHHPHLEKQKEIIETISNWLKNII